MNRTYLILLLFIITLASCTKQNKQTGFAIVVDEKTHNLAKDEINAYAEVLESEGLKTFIVIDKWHNPDSIKTKLKSLYYSDTPIEGSVFIGDIPIPMLRDAQHLSSAFKMDQKKFEWNRSSIPSDRFYDDFDLEFTFLKKDETNPLYFYYSLTADSEQKLQSEIYTGRIKAPHNKDRYHQIKMYLRKVVRMHKEEQKVRNLMYFAGHGYNSESMVSRIDEKITLLEQFPSLNKQKNAIEFIDFSFDDNVKFRLLPELKRDDLDIAILHHHGGATAQYLNGMPESSNVRPSIFNIKYYLRSKIRSAQRRKKEVNETIADYKKNLDVPLSWFEGWDKDESIKEDSITNANLDIYVEDLDDYKSNARFIMFDACFNGSFHKEDYLSGRYIFNEGNTVVGMANSVNCIQDKWPNQLLGLLDCGIRLGNIHKYTAYLETHIIGDPTFKFKSNYDIELNNDITLERKNSDYWLALLDHELAEVQCLALRLLEENKYEDLSNIAKKKYFQSSFNTVRLACLNILANYNNDDFIDVLCAATEDSYELIRRLAAYYIADSGDERCIPVVIKTNLKNNKGRRIRYVFKDALSFFKKERLLEELDKQIDKNNYFLDKESTKQSFKKLIENQARSADKRTKEILSADESTKAKALSIRNLRNKPYHQYAEDYCDFALKTDNDDLRLLMIEAFGWFTHSVKKDYIIKTCKQIAADEKYKEEIRQEALKTINRLK